MTINLAHDVDCMCVRCLNADLDSHIESTLGRDALIRINAGTQSDKAHVKPVKTFGKAPGSRSGRGIVRGMSDAQKRYVTMLINTRDTSNMRLLTGWTLDISELHTISLRHASAFIDALKACPMKAQAPSESVKNEIRGSARQIDWITKGINGKPSLLKERGILSESDIKALYIRCNYIASNIISELIAMPKHIEKTQVELSEGMYKVEDRIFKVYFNQAGSHLLAKELIDGRFEYQGAASRFVKAENRMTLEEAKEYGKVTGTCCVCSRRLTDEGSIEAGIGPICAGKF